MGFRDLVEVYFFNEEDAERRQEVKNAEGGLVDGLDCLELLRYGWNGGGWDEKRGKLTLNPHPLIPLPIAIGIGRGRQTRGVLCVRITYPIKRLLFSN